jgi:hypothetical protein
MTIEGSAPRLLRYAGLGLLLVAAAGLGLGLAADQDPSLVRKGAVALVLALASFGLAGFLRRYGGAASRAASTRASDAAHSR